MVIKNLNGDIKMIDLKAFIKRPFQFEGTPMHPNVLLMCKIMVLLLVAHHIFSKIDDPYIPFIPALDHLNDYPNLFKYSMRSLFVLSAFALLFNLKVRIASIIIGIVIIINMLASKPVFNNHTFICACALFLAGLTNNKQTPYLLILQLSLVYFGASINKFLEADWWSGAFMDNWLGNARENPIYLYVSKFLPELVLAKLLSYVAMFTEFAIAILLLFKRTRNLTIWFIIIFHVSLFTLTSFRFGHFIESLMITLLAFLSIPKQQLDINYDTPKLKPLKLVFNWLDFDDKHVWKPIAFQNSKWLSLTIKSKTIYNHEALKDILLYTPNFFMLLFFIDSVIYILLYNHRTVLFIINALFIWSMIFYFLPISWHKLKKK
ncbi:HTTM domain-containing protein [uncultured Psychroserpens sp.]|uniref:HTTM domain-containing protein n=1 Tax=uncultured Psychroserpens sp. TaxID=255436 RepID=UPI002632F45F|nr:HTTM domain-containing protein [uncultured Psychroserpens sp.]